MASIFTPREPRLASPSFWTIVWGLVLLYFGLSGRVPPTYVWLAVGLGAAFLVIGVGTNRGQRWAVLSGAIVYSILVLGVLALLFSGVTLNRFFMLIGFGWLAGNFIHCLRKPTPLPIPEDGEKDTDAEEGGPKISLVLLLSKPRYLEENVLAEIVQDAWGGRYIGDDEDELDGFVVGGENALFYIVNAPFGMFMVHNSPTTYWEDETEEVAEELGELRLRKAVLDHQAWLAVDMMGDGDQEVGYAQVVRLITALADPEDTLAVMRPATYQINVWSDDVFDTLIRPDGPDRFDEAGPVPVIPVEADDPLLEAAVAEAHERWPEFAEAFAGRSADDPFSIKAGVTVGDVTEYIWLTVDGIAGDVVFGELANDPIDLGDLELGSKVEVDLEDLNDWAYALGDSEPVGLFTVAAVTEAQRRFREERDASR